MGPFHNYCKASVLCLHAIEPHMYCIQVRKYINVPIVTDIQFIFIGASTSEPHGSVK